MIIQKLMFENFMSKKCNLLINKLLFLLMKNIDFFSHCFNTFNRYKKFYFYCLQAIIN